MDYSLIVPVYNRPEELRELLSSVMSQTYSGSYEVLIIDDGSTSGFRGEDVCKEFIGGRVPVRYYYRSKNSGPGPCRNYGAAQASGNFLIILDSDVILPSTYLEELDRGVRATGCDAFGGADAAHESFTPIQKAISYSMTSFFTTGGIRGGKKKLDKFYPRSYNMGIRRSAYMALGGFSEMRYGEDIDFSIRLMRGGYKCVLLPGAWVWHKRRTSFKAFYNQVHHSGEARIALYKKYPETLKLVHCLPSVFVVCFPLWFVYWLFLLVDGLRVYRSLSLAWLCVRAGYVQMFGYGLGFLRAYGRRHES